VRLRQKNAFLSYFPGRQVPISMRTCAGQASAKLTLISRLSATSGATYRQGSFLEIDGLRLFMAHAVDAIVLEYHLGLLDGGMVADEIKQVRPQLPVVILAEHLELPDDALKSMPWAWRWRWLVSFGTYGLGTNPWTLKCKLVYETVGAWDSRAESSGGHCSVLDLV
jgi:CheY-like chemotaxis protein